MLTGTSHLTLASVPSVASDNHSQLVSEVLHLMNLSECSRMVDFIQALHHVRLIAEEMEQRHNGRAAAQCAVYSVWLRLRVLLPLAWRQKRLYRPLLETCHVTTGCYLAPSGQWNNSQLSTIVLGGTCH